MCAHRPDDARVFGGEGTSSLEHARVQLRQISLLFGDVRIEDVSARGARVAMTLPQGGMLSLS